MYHIEFEGIDGSGKTTAYDYVCDRLTDLGFKVLRTREVGNPHLPVCVELRKLVLNPERQLDGKTMEFIFAAMRIENQKFYESVKDQYDFIISDRGWLSHLAYTDNNVNPAFTDLFYAGVVSEFTVRPDYVVFLELAPETALARRSKRNGFVDAIEMKGPQFQEAVYNSFVKHIKNESNNFDVLRVDAEQDIEGVRSQLDSMVETWSHLLDK